MDAPLSRIRLNKLSTGSHRFWKFLVAVAVGAIFVACCYFWIDRALAFWVHTHQSHFVARDDLNAIAGVPNPAVLVSLVMFFLLGGFQLAGRALNRFEQVVLASSTSVLVGETIKDILKWVFGRPSPDIWVTSNSSAIGSQEYHFHWFHGIEPFNAFPSGHMTAVTAVIAILWIHYPRFRPIYAVSCLTVAAGLIAFNFHFLGDVIAGALLGAMVGLLASSSLLEKIEERFSSR
jgi:membrane-associated phospholipid phosphatase